jgi:hypothetical protein
MDLDGKRIAILATHGFEQSERRLRQDSRHGPFVGGGVRSCTGVDRRSEVVRRAAYVGYDDRAFGP